MPKMTTQLNIKGFYTALHNRLEEKGINFEQFIEWLKTNKAIIAGSYILQVLIGEKWKGSDIDVYIMGYDYTPLPNAKLAYSEIYKPKNYKNNDILRVTEWSIGDKDDPTTVQIMNISPVVHSNLTKFIDLYDLDFCKVIFDGSKLNIMYPESIKTRTSVYNCITDWNGRKDYRTQKYIKRGFKIIG